MNQLSRRLKKLESNIQGKGRVISFFAEAHHTDADLAACMAAHALVETPNDLLVCFRTVYEDRHGAIASGAGAVSLSVSTMR